MDRFRKAMTNWVLNLRPRFRVSKSFVRKRRSKTHWRRTNSNWRRMRRRRRMRSWQRSTEEMVALIESRPMSRIGEGIGEVRHCRVHSHSHSRTRAMWITDATVASAGNICRESAMITMSTIDATETETESERETEIEIEIADRIGRSAGEGVVRGRGRGHGRADEDAVVTEIE